MNKFLGGCAALLTLFVTVESLSCYTCDVKFIDSCFHERTVNCTKSQNRCFTAVAKFNADLLDIHERGCIEEKDCRNENGSILTIDYTITRTCCNTDKCNGAATIRLPLSAALCAALVAVWCHLAL